MKPALKTWELMKLPLEAINNCGFCKHVVEMFAQDVRGDDEYSGEPIGPAPCNTCLSYGYAGFNNATRSEWEWDENYE